MDYTDPVNGLMEGLGGLFGKQKPHVMTQKENEEYEKSEAYANIKDVTPDPSEVQFRAIIEAYNNGDVIAQCKFIKMLLKYDGGKVQDIKEEMIKNGVLK